MTVSNYGKKWFKPFFAGSLLLLTGCFNLIGRAHLDEIPPPYQLKPLTLETVEGKPTAIIVNEALTLKMEWQGAAQPLASHRNTLGWVTRYVVPYTHDTQLFRLTVENQSQDKVAISPKQIILETLPKTEPVLTPLSLSYFKAQWPTQAVRTPDMLVDQWVAMGEVIRTLFQEQVILPQQTVSGILAFPHLNEPQTVKSLHLKIQGIQFGDDKFDAIFLFDRVD